MKINNKIIVSGLASVMGVSLVGAVSGTVAWYQYSTRATASIIGVSAGQTGTLLIKEHSEDDSLYSRDILTARLKGSNTAAKLYPVTYGGVATSAETKTLDANVGTFKSNPQVGEADMATWKAATAAKEYIQYTVDLKAVKADGTAKSGLAVYVSDIVLADNASATGTDVTSALRIHIHTSTEDLLISSSKIEGTNLPTFGKLDLDNDGQADKKGGYEWAADRDNVVTYGTDATYQTTYGISDVKATRNAETGLLSGGMSIGTTNESGVLTVTVTIWLEGWAQLNAYEAPKDTDVKSIWAANSTGKTIHAGLTFDVGDGAFAA